MHGKDTVHKLSSSGLLVKVAFQLNVLEMN